MEIANPMVPQSSNLFTGLASSSEAAAESSAWEKLPEELIGAVLALLPLPTLLHASTVCKKWNSVVSSLWFKKQCIRAPAQRPWLVAMTDAPLYGDTGVLSRCVAYSSVERRWYKLPMAVQGELVAGAPGLLCILNYDPLLHRIILHIWDPVSNYVKCLPPIDLDSPFDWWSTKVAVEVIENSCPLLYRVLFFAAPTVWSLGPRMMTRIFDSTANAWRTASPVFPFPNSSILSHALSEGYVYFALGMSHGQMRIAAYNIQQDFWMDLETPPIFQLLNDCRLVDCQGQLMAVGFQGSVLQARRVWLLDTSNKAKEWKQLDTSVGPRPSTGLEANRNFCAGGSKGEVYLYGSDHEPVLYDQSSSSWSPLPPCPELQCGCRLELVSYEPRWGVCVE